MGCEKWRDQLPDVAKLEQNKESPSKPFVLTEPLECGNRFVNLNVEFLVLRDEAELEIIALNSSTDDSVTSQSGETANKGKSKRQVELLENYKNQSENEIHFVTYFSMRDFLEMKR